ncbi:MAG: cyclase family protein [Acidobacteriota bacterium]|nr:cyclase family protein [Acidobacteriota bacterium]
MVSFADKPIRSKEEVTISMKALSNWGRWGKDDQYGALNLITPAKRLEAAREVCDGVSVSLAHNVITRRAFLTPPFKHRMIETGVMPGSQSAGDVFTMQVHGYTETHLDALCHVFYGGSMYNGYSQQEVTEKGCGKLSVIEMKNGIFTRGVMMDFPELFGAKYLEGHRAIRPSDLDSWEKATGVKVESGDAVFIRTGRWTRYEAEGEWDVEHDSAGLDVSCVPWFRKRDVAVLGSDLALDVMPSGVRGVRLPVHALVIVAMGVPILDSCDLEALSREAAARRRWTFLLTVAPLAVDKGSGSPVNPMATF